MRVTVLGTGTVGRTLAVALATAGHSVTVATRDPGRRDVAAWAGPAGVVVRVHAAAVPGAEVVVNATAGVASLDALALAAPDAYDGVVLLDVANAIDASAGWPPSLAAFQAGSLAEQIQQRYPGARVVKALNTVNADVMAGPRLLAGAHVLPLAGDDARAKEVVAALLADLGWPREWLLDLGGLAAARGMEAYVLFWRQVYGALGTARFNIALARAAG